MCVLGYTENVTYIVGVGKHCKPSQFCNGPLHSGTEYCIMIRGFTEDGYRDTEKVCFITGK